MLLLYSMQILLPEETFFLQWLRTKMLFRHWLLEPPHQGQHLSLQTSHIMSHNHVISHYQYVTLSGLTWTSQLFEKVAQKQT